MNYLIFDSIDAANAFSSAIATAQGCGPGTPTVYWYMVLRNTITGAGACVISGDGGPFGTAYLNDAQIAALVPAPDMDPSWFPTQEISA